MGIYEQTGQKIGQLVDEKNAAYGDALWASDWFKLYREWEASDRYLA